VPESGRWRFSAALSGAPIHIEHIEDNDFYNVVPYWHVQDLIVSELDATAVRGIRPGAAFAITVPLRLVRDRIRYEDLARQPYVPPYPDLHHRNETLFHVADVLLAMPLARPVSGWMLGVNPGVSIPIGRTEPDPFQLGAAGLPHQHIQFGTGTFDPSLGLSVSRNARGILWSATGNLRLTLYQNSHEYQAGNRYGATIGVLRRLGEWNANTALGFLNEQAERWHGQVQSEGNLGRSDLAVMLGLGHAVARTGVWTLNAQIPVITHVVGQQVHIPVVFSLVWSR